MNTSAVFGIGIAVGQTPADMVEGQSIAGDPADWSTDDPALTIPAATNDIFLSNGNFGGANSGGITWFGMESNQSATNGVTISYAGGTLGTSGNVAETFTDGVYDIYLISRNSFTEVSAAAVPEPSSLLIAFFSTALSTMFFRRRS